MQNWLWESFSNMPNGTSYNWNSNTNPNGNGNGNDNDNTKPGFWSQLLSGLQQNIVSKPVEFGSNVLGGAFNIWQALDNRQRYKQALALDREKYELSKQIALNNEQRNQEQWDMIKRQRASSAL